MSDKKVSVTKSKNNATRSSTKKQTVKKEVVTERYIDPKNYLYAFIILVGGILLTLYIFEWYNVKKEEKLQTSYLITSNTLDSRIVGLETLNQIRQEAPSSYFIYLSYTGDEEVYNLEKKLKRLIDKYGLNDIFYYVDLSELKVNNQDYLKIIESNLAINSLKNLPAIIYVENGEIYKNNILDGINNTKLKVTDLEELLDVYEFETIK